MEGDPAGNQWVDPILLLGASSLLALAAASLFVGSIYLSAMAGVSGAAVVLTRAAGSISRAGWVLALGTAGTYLTWSTVRV